MKVWKSLRKKKATLLSALLALSVSGGALVMPQGGAQFGGPAVTVSDGSSLANLLNDATLTVNGTSVINWNSFNIAKDEALTVNLQGHSLLNHVTGGSPTELFGKLTAINGGDGVELFVVNPSGIIVGNGAVLNVPNLTLSTLDLANDDLTAFVNDARGDVRVGGEKRSASGQGRSCV